MEKISLGKFKAETHHKKVVYEWIKKDNSKSRKFESNKFYCNKDYKSKMLSMPFFMLAFKTEFYKVAENHFIALSEFGKTNFVVVV